MSWDACAGEMVGSCFRVLLSRAHPHTNTKQTASPVSSLQFPASSTLRRPSERTVWILFPGRHCPLSSLLQPRTACFWGNVCCIFARSSDALESQSGDGFAERLCDSGEKPRGVDPGKRGRAFERTDSDGLTPALSNANGHRRLTESDNRAVLP